MENEAIDLVAVASALGPEHRKLANLILQLRDSHSIRTDLHLANDFLGTMDGIKGQASNERAGGDAENAYLALFYSALVLYVRATKTQHDNRRSFDFVSDYDDGQKAKHQMLCDLRDKALAHYGTGGVYNGPAFQKDGVFIPFSPDGSSKVMTASRRLVINPQLVADLAAMSHRALMLADKRAQGLNDKVVAELNRAIAETPEIVQFLRDRSIEAVEFFGDESAMKEVLAGPRVGYRRGTSRHSGDGD